MNQQLTELLTNYGPIGGIWFDGMWDKPDADWRLARTYGLIHSLQPAALIGNNHHRLPFPGEDFQMFEKDLPGQKTAEFNTTSEVGKLPLETCDTINTSWGYNKNDKHFKSTAQLIQYLARGAGYNANFLLNIGPMPTGKIQPEFVERLHGMGRWLEHNGESIYGTRGGPLPPFRGDRSAGMACMYTYWLRTAPWRCRHTGRWTAKSWPDGRLESSYKRRRG
jgi:alpha-L-fucosidase